MISLRGLPFSQGKWRKSGSGGEGRVEGGGGGLGGAEVGDTVVEM